MQHYIYRTTCIPTGKYYIGKHSTKSTRPYYGSGIMLKRSLKKYGRHQHIVEILQFAPCEQTLSQLERSIITENVLNDPNCMNLMIGGEGGFNDNQRKASREAFRQKLQDPEYRQRISDQNRERAKKVTAEGRRNCSEALKEKYKDPEFKAAQAARARERQALSVLARKRKKELLNITGGQMNPLNATKVSSN